jgi:hypothetical protein|tara:strand:+ start:783 stop:998 length:216 start_codon:yes stop_codon:yes gene_type:complete
MSGKYWFTNLKEDERKYIEDHPDPSHMVFYLKKGLSFLDSLKLGYIDSITEDIEISANSLAQDNKYNNPFK